MGKQRLLSEKEISRRVKDMYGSSTPSIDEAIVALRATYPEYRRQKVQVLTRVVKRILASDKGKEGKRKCNDDSIVETMKRRRMELQSESSGQEDVSAAVSTCDSLLSKLEHKNEEIIELVAERETKNAENLTLDREDNGEDNGPMFKDIGGMDDVLNELKREVILPLIQPDLLKILGVKPVSGILLHGPPGCGKTRLAKAIAREAEVPFYNVSATNLVSGVSGASEENIRELFSKAYTTAPSIVFIDEIDVIASKRENLQREMEKRIVAQLLASMDSTKMRSRNHGGHVLVIAATNRPDALDQAIRRPGRIDREICIPVPDENTRAKILSVIMRNVKTEADLDPDKIARLTPGFVAADLVSMLGKAGAVALSRTVCERILLEGTEATEDSWKKLAWTSKEKNELTITLSDIKEAIRQAQPSSKREGFSSIPDVKWQDVGGLDSLRADFQSHILDSLTFSKEVEASGMGSKTGFLLFGPQGCGKTLIAKAVANEAGANFIHVQGPELMNKFVGETEKAVRTIFSRARTCSPCIIFFDEVDALAPKRGNEGSWVVDRTLMQLMLELDGGNQRKGVYVIGATNRPEAIDTALLRPGRLGKLMYVPLPNPDERGLILKALSKNKHIDAEVDLMAIAQSEACTNFSGADLSELLEEAAMFAFKEYISTTKAAAAHGGGASVSSSRSFVPPTIKNVHFEQAFRKIKPSVSDEEKHYYDLMAKRLIKS